MADAAQAAPAGESTGSVGTVEPTRIMVLTGDPLGRKIAGPAIRAWNMAEVLSRRHAVALVTFTHLEKGLTAPFALHRVRPGDDEAFEALEEWADVIVLQGHAMTYFPSLQTSEKVIVVDIYDPMHLEQLEQGKELPRGTWELNVQTATHALNQQLAVGDFFMCASERQRPFYLGQLAALGRLNPATYEHDPHLRKLLSVVPFGLSSEPPVHRKQVLKGVRDGIGPDDKVLLWGGGLYNWFDPKTLIRAVAKVAERHDDVRLFFMGTKHPGVEEMAIVRESRELAAKLGVLDRSVFFNDTWVDFDDRANYLLEADAGVSTHKLHIETTFSFRTRILDYLWAGLPMIVTEGDSFADLVQQEKLGVVVPAKDPDALADAIERVLFDDAFAQRTRKNVAKVRKRFTWEKVLEPLTKFVRKPSKAADRLGLVVAPLLGALGQPATGARKPYGFRHDVRMMLHHLRHSGPRVVLKKLWRRIADRAR